MEFSGLNTVVGEGRERRCPEWRFTGNTRFCFVFRSVQTVSTHRRVRGIQTGIRFWTGPQGPLRVVVRPMSSPVRCFRRHTVVLVRVKKEKKREESPRIGLVRDPNFPETSLRLFSCHWVFYHWRSRRNVTAHVKSVQWPTSIVISRGLRSLSCFSLFLSPFFFFFKNKGGLFRQN